MKGIWKHSEFWPSANEFDKITMGEGNTPLIPSSRIGKRYGIPRLWFKMETSNPTGSYKDRFGAAAITHLVGRNSKICLATSSGNTGASLAAYCARAGIACFILTVDGAPAGKINQMKIYGAHTLMVRGFGIDAEISETVFNRLKDMCQSLNTDVQISGFAYSPEGMQGVESIGFEIANEFKEQNLKVFSPSGGGGLALAVGRGFLKWKEKFNEYNLPQLFCVQPEGNNTIAGVLAGEGNHAVPVKESTTAISGLQVPNLIDGDQTIEICRTLNGGGQLVSDELVFQVQKELAAMEGIYCEPAGAVALAGAIRAKQKGLIPKDDAIICLITGHGFKDPASVERMIVQNDDYFEGIDGAEKYINQKLSIKKNENE